MTDANQVDYFVRHAFNEYTLVLRWYNPIDTLKRLLEKAVAPPERSQ